MLLIVMSGLQDVQAQSRYAAFVHGFTFGDDRPQSGATAQDILNAKGQRWKASGTIDYLQNQVGVIDGHVMLKYFDRDLYGGSRDRTLDNTRQAMMERFVRKMKNTAPNAEWLLIGHSQGGIVVRLLREHVRKYAPELNVSTVIAIASPMQGAKPTTVSYGKRSGYKNAKPKVNGFLKDILKAPLAEAGEGLVEFWVPWGHMPINIISNFWDPYEYAAERIIRLQEEDIAQSLNGMAVEKRAKDAIGPDGYLIEEINNAPDPENYRALLGIERAPAFARVASGASTEAVNTIGFSPFERFGILEDMAALGNPRYATFRNVFTRDQLVRPGEEPKTVNLFYQLKGVYRDAADYYRHRCYWTLGISCATGDYRKWNRWKDGRQALEGFESTYSYILAADRMATRQGERLVCKDPTTGEVVGRSMVQATFDVPSAESFVHGRFEPPDDDGDGRDDNDGTPGNECWNETYTYLVSVPNKTDGLLGSVTTGWDGDPDFMYTHAGPETIVYSDTPSRNQYYKGGTGFNHAEMIYARRRYSANQDPGIPDGSFSRGDLNPPTRDVRDFMIESGL
ncbi:hypothetical protein CRI94_07090 [Longibacter salinarum]|uniref:Alpha/beta hydrolase n=1 Tax=Longibacter salinarum TaxID=1850348 RepID=A0A2A8CYN5_9BACT|nr:hypothetical protein CRI94_07090 [Longibacter salinarum]